MSRHLQLRLEKLPPEIPAIGWKAQVRLCKRYRQLTHVNQVVVAIAREIAAFAWPIARLVPGASRIGTHRHAGGLVIQWTARDVLHECVADTNRPLSELVALLPASAGGGVPQRGLGRPHEEAARLDIPARLEATRNTIRSPRHTDPNLPRIDRR